MGKIIITGVDGNFGGFVADVILGKVAPDKLVFTSPNLEKLKKYEKSGVDLRVADFNDPGQLKDAFADGEVLLLISMPFVGERRRNAHKNAIDAAVAAGVKKIIYTSIVGSGDDNCESYEKVDHQYTENYILGTDLNYVILRDSQYCEAMVSAFEDAFDNKNGVLSNNMGDGKMAHVARNDCALAAACVAAGAGEDNKIYYISGLEAMSISKFLEIGSEVTGKKVTYKYISDEEMYDFFDSLGVPRYTDGEWAEAAKAFPFCSEGMVTFGKAIRLDQMSFCTNDFEILTGQKPLSVSEIFMNIENHRVGERTSTDTYK